MRIWYEVNKIKKTLVYGTRKPAELGLEEACLLGPKSVHRTPSQTSRTRSSTSTTTLLRYISPWSAPCTTLTRQRPGPIVRSIQRTAFSAIFSSRSPYHTRTICGYAEYENSHGC